MSVVDVPHVMSLTGAAVPAPVVFVPADPVTGDDLAQVLAVDWWQPLVDVWQATAPSGSGGLIAEIEAASARTLRWQSGFERGVNRHAGLVGAGVVFPSARVQSGGPVADWIDAQNTALRLSEARKAGDSTRTTRNAARAAYEAAEGLSAAACSWYASEVLQPIRAGVALLTPEGNQ